MQLTITVNHPHITLYLKDGTSIIDKLSWEDSNNLSRKLLSNIDNLLKKNIIKIQDLAGVNVETSQASYTSSRIARTVAKTVEYCLTRDPRNV